MLVVEDDAIIAISREPLFERLRGFVGAMVGRVDHARAAIERAKPDAAVLDVHPGRGRDNYPVARALADRQLPFLFVTGHGRDGVGEEFRDHPIVDKPVREWQRAQAPARLSAARAEAAFSA